MSKNGLLGPEGFALWTRAAIVLKGESWERAPGVLRGLSSPLDFFAAGLVGGLVGGSIRAAMTAASKSAAFGGVAVPRGGLRLGGAASLAGSDMVSLDIFVKGTLLFDVQLGGWRF